MDGLSKLNSVTGPRARSRSTLFQASRVHRTAEAINGSDAYRSKSSGIP